MAVSDGDEAAVVLRCSSVEDAIGRCTFEEKPFLARGMDMDGVWRCDEAARDGCCQCHSEGLDSDAARRE